MNSQNPYETRQPKAFISCSLREEDQPFVDYIVRIVGLFGFRPVGTVGKYDAAPKPIWQLMKENIKSADCIVLVATPRYLQQDIRDKRDTGKAMSELLHTEVGMAVAMERPVLAFVLEGTNVGNLRRADDALVARVDERSRKVPQHRRVVPRRAALLWLKAQAATLYPIRRSTPVKAP